MINLRKPKTNELLKSISKDIFDLLEFKYIGLYMDDNIKNNIIDDVIIILTKHQNTNFNKFDVKKQDSIIYIYMTINEIDYSLKIGLM